MYILICTHFSCSTSGLVIISTPIDVRFFSPPLMPFTNPPPTIESAHFSSPNSTIVREAIDFISSDDTVEGNRRRAENSIASLGVTVLRCASSCITYAMRWRNCTGSTRLPPTVTVPPTVAPALVAA